MGCHLSAARPSVPQTSGSSRPGSAGLPQNTAALALECCRQRGVRQLSIVLLPRLHVSQHLTRLRAPCQRVRNECQHAPRCGHHHPDACCTSSCPRLQAPPTLPWGHHLCHQVERVCRPRRRADLVRVRGQGEGALGAPHRRLVGVAAQPQHLVVVAGLRGVGGWGGCVGARVRVALEG
jgi:hypothetical protein